ncbi:MAG: hypothetical protein REJ23_09050, partial [Brevundimonas sp.]|nr:hypothetical protein [Brevundimonas sp.]
PEQGGLGYARPINFEARLNEGVFDWNGEAAFSSEIFRTPPPTSGQPLVRLAPGQSHVYELPFDGIFDAHGGPVRETAPWRGRFVFYYSMTERTVALLRQDGVAMPVMDRASPVTSNPLDCG